MIDATAPISLCFLYFILFGFAIFKLASIANLPNKVTTFRNGILFTLLLESMIRTVYWAITSVRPALQDEFKSLFRVLYFVPVWLNFAGLSLLCTFYAQVSMMKRYNSSVPVKVCFFSNIIFLTLNISFALLAERSKFLQVLYISYAVFLDAFTAVCVGYFGSLFVNKAQSKRQWVLPCSVKVFNTVNRIIVFCFLTRSVLVAILSFGWLDQQSYGAEASEHRNSWTIFCFFFFTEWIPNVSMFCLLWNPTAVQSSPRKNHFQGINQDGEEQESLVTLIFDHEFVSDSEHGYFTDPPVSEF
jgi:hypothetical protein